MSHPSTTPLTENTHHALAERLLSIVRETYQGEDVEVSVANSKLSITFHLPYEVTRLGQINVNVPCGLCEKFPPTPTMPKERLSLSEISEFLTLEQAKDIYETKRYDDIYKDYEGNI